jgi:hypothetical protein
MKITPICKFPSRNAKRKQPIPVRKKINDRKENLFI